MHKLCRINDRTTQIKLAEFAIQAGVTPSIDIVYFERDLYFEETCSTDVIRKMDLFTLGKIKSNLII